MPATKFGSLKLFLYILLFFSGEFCSVINLKAQNFDPSMVCASYVLPLQEGDWPLEIGTEAQLFVDDFLIHSMSQVVRTDHQPKKYENNPVLVADRANGTIVYNPEAKQYRMYYDNGHRVAFSKDGFNLTKPNLGIVLIEGSTDNNFIMDYSYRTNLTSFIYDPHDAEC